MDTTHVELTSDLGTKARRLARAYSAGREAHGEALQAYRFVGRTDWEVRMQTPADAFWLWAADVSEGDWNAAECAFAAGWQDAIDAL
jgi:hypothetical protein